jgi:hypothetical protein
MTKHQTTPEERGARIAAATAAGITPYRASAIVEGFDGGENAGDEERRMAWQFLHDTGIGYQLQGWYGRTLASLLAGEYIDL